MEMSLSTDQKDRKEKTALTSNENMKQMNSALFYGCVSFSLTMVNKNILTVYGFPSIQCLGLAQMFATIIVLYTARSYHLISFPSLQKNNFLRLWPLPLVSMGNLLLGLNGTKELSLPMFTALRRFLILFTMIGEHYVMRVPIHQAVQTSVLIMLAGAFVAAYDDLGFSTPGYLCIFLYNVFSAASGIYTRFTLQSKNSLGINGLLFYNSFFMFLPTLLVAYASGELEKGRNFEQWNDGVFLLQFLVSCFMGLLLRYSVMLCSTYNSALTTSIVGCSKNICITYVGMLIGYDYIFSWINFIGINISVLGSLVYLANQSA